MTQTSIDVIL